MRLTPREIDCLYWASMGKTSWEIGKILGIAERTANFHLSNSYPKLRVCNRQAAVAKVHQMGLFSRRRGIARHSDKMKPIQTFPVSIHHEPGLRSARPVGSASRTLAQRTARHRKRGPAR